MSSLVVVGLEPAVECAGSVWLVWPVAPWARSARRVGPVRFCRWFGSVGACAQVAGRTIRFRGQGFAVGSRGRAGRCLTDEVRARRCSWPPLRPAPGVLRARTRLRGVSRRAPDPL
jgi:hypothetical protein